MKKIIVGVLLSVAMVASVLTGCSSGSGNKSSDSSKTDSEYTIGFVPMTLNNEYFIIMCNAAKEKAKELGVNIEVQAADSHADAADQLTIVENMITSNVNAICIVPSSSEGLATAVKKCEEAGIKVFNIDTKLDESVTSSVDMEIPFYD